MNIELVKRLREETHMKVRDCVSALENSNWDYETALKAVYVFEAAPESKPLDKNPLMVINPDIGRVDILFYDGKDRLIYRKGNIIDGTWEPVEIIVDELEVPALDNI